MRNASKIRISRYPEPESNPLGTVNSDDWNTIFADVGGDPALSQLREGPMLTGHDLLLKHRLRCELKATHLLARTMARGYPA